MPLGIIADVLSIFIGSIIGTFGGKHLPNKLKEALPMAFSMATMVMAVTSLVKLQNLPVVILSLILGVIIGTLCGFERLMRHFGEWAASLFAKAPRSEAAAQSARLSRPEQSQRMKAMPLHTDPSQRARNLEYFAIAVILFCTGPTGIYGVIQASIAGDNSLLYTKAFLDIFTAAIFASSAGVIICFLTLPVFAIFTFFFLLSGFLAPLITPAMLADFSGCGGLLILATGFRMAQIKMYPVSDMLPALVLVMPLSYLWSLLPL